MNENEVGKQIFWVDFKMNDGVYEVQKGGNYSGIWVLVGIDLVK